MKSILEVVANIRDLVLQGRQVIFSQMFFSSKNTKLQEQSFMVVCDVTSENKEVIKQLEDAHVSVQHRSRTKKDSSDEVLRQQMRKVVDMINYEIEYVLRPVSAPPRLEISSLFLSCSIMLF